MTETKLEHYLIAALWSSNNWDDMDESDNPTPFDDNYSIGDISDGFRESSLNEIADFLELLEKEGIDWESKISEEQFGHDFWLTRNGHGAGFWDRGLGELGDKLTEWCKPYGSVDLFVGDDEFLHGE